MGFGLQGSPGGLSQAEFAVRLSQNHGSLTQLGSSETSVVVALIKQVSIRVAYFLKIPRFSVGL